MPKNNTPNEGHSIQPRQCARWKMNGFPHNACILNVIDHTCINNPWNSHMWRNKSTLRFYLQIIWKCSFVSFSETFYASLPPYKDIQPVEISVMLCQSAPLNPHSVTVDDLDTWEWEGPETDRFAYSGYIMKTYTFLSTLDHTWDFRKILDVRHYLWQKQSSANNHITRKSMCLHRITN